MSQKTKRIYMGLMRATTVTNGESFTETAFTAKRFDDIDTQILPL
eukprot:gene24656-31024_t